MNSVGRAAAIFASAISICAFVLALLGGSILYAAEGVIRMIAPNTALSYPLGAWVFLVYVLGLCAGLAALRWPVPAGIFMLPLGACAFFLGGPVAQVFGIVIACCAGILMLASLRRSHGASTRPTSW